MKQKFYNAIGISSKNSRKVSDVDGEVDKKLEIDVAEQDSDVTCNIHGFEEDEVVLPTLEGEA